MVYCLTQIEQTDYVHKDLIGATCTAFLNENAEKYLQISKNDFHDCKICLVVPSGSMLVIRKVQ